MYPFRTEITEKSCDTYGFLIHMAGDYDQAQQILRKYCTSNGACFSISKSKYIYSGGEEEGFIVRVMNYPRFPNSYSVLEGIANSIAYQLMVGLNQGSYTIEPYKSDTSTKFYSRRSSD